MTAPLDLDAIALSLVPGPSDGPDVTDSVSVRDIADISCREIVDALLGLPGVRVTTPNALPTSWSWRAELATDDATIELEMTLFELDDGRFTWGGFGLHGLATKSEVARIAQHLASRCGAIWVHDGDCRMWRPHVFEVEYTE